MARRSGGHGPRNGEIWPPVVVHGHAGCGPHHVAATCAHAEVTEVFGAGHVQPDRQWCLCDNWTPNRSTSVWRSLRTGTAGAGAGPQRSAWPARRSTGLAAVGTVKPEATLELGDAGGMDSDRGAKLGNHGIAVGKGRRQVRDPVGQ